MRIPLASLSYTLSSKTRLLSITTKSIVEYLQEHHPTIVYRPHKQDKVITSSYPYYTASDLPRFISVYVPTECIELLPPLPFAAKRKHFITKRIIIPFTGKLYIVKQSQIVKIKIPLTRLTYKYTAPTRIAIRMHSLHLALLSLHTQGKMPLYKEVFNPNKKTLLFSHKRCDTHHYSTYDTVFKQKIYYPYIVVHIPYGATEIDATLHTDGHIVLEGTQA